MLRYSVVNRFRSIKSLRLVNFCTQNLQFNPNITEPPSSKIDRKTIEHLERLSLVDFGDERGIKIVEDAIEFADKLNEVDTTGVEPLITVLENEPLFLREDKAETDVTRSELLSHSKEVLQDYYVAPIGNIEFTPQEKNYYKSKEKVIEEKIKNEELMAEES